MQRLTLPRDEGGRGLIDITNLHNQQITNLRKFFQQKADQSHFHKVISLLDKHTPLNLHSTGPQANEHITSKTNKIAAWAHKSLHGRHRLDLQQPHVDMKASNLWLRRGELFPEMEGFMIAIQDQVIANYQKCIIHRPHYNDSCRRCDGASQTIQHITGACRAIAQTDYKHRHDQVASIIHQSLAIQTKLTTERLAKIGKKSNIYETKISKRFKSENKRLIKIVKRERVRERKMGSMFGGFTPLAYLGS
ncbi:hypothetical protein ACJJTC_010472 [Scirpophaga incertulas]